MNCNYLILLLFIIINNINSSLNKNELHTLFSNKIEFDTSSKCPYDFKVYIYPLSPHLGPIYKAEEARRNGTYHICKKCIFEQFALEYVVLDFLTQFCGRTYNPKEADYFYLPIVRDIEYRIHLYEPGGRKPSPIENVLLEVIVII
jgi:hypothetical protein